jgi:hypothetical protein
MSDGESHVQLKEGSCPSRCSCGAEVDRPGDEYCKTCFEAAFSEVLA